MDNERIHSETSEESMNKKMNANIDHLVQSKISNSGNSNVNVDIKIEVDVKPIAFAILYSLFVNNQLTEQQLEEALKRLDSILTI